MAWNADTPGSRFFIDLVNQFARQRAMILDGVDCQEDVGATRDFLLRAYFNSIERDVRFTHLDWEDYGATRGGRRERVDARLKDFLDHLAAQKPAPKPKRE